MICSQAIEIAIPATAIERAIATSKASEQRNRSLPAQHLSLSLLYLSHQFLFFCPLMPENTYFLVD
ncbi:MAG: hypothetical protein V7K15_28725 [Nostoc sp.]